MRQVVSFKRLAAGLPVVAALLLFALLYLMPGAGPASSSHAGGADAFSIDMDPEDGDTNAGAFNPVNTASSLGPRQECARINLNGSLDADEDLTADRLTFDVTVTNVPPPGAVGFSYRILYNESALTLQGMDFNLFLAQLPGSNVLSFSEGLPDTNGDNQWKADFLDIGDSGTTAETGSGVVVRHTISADSGAASGLYPLDFDSEVTFHVDANGEGSVADAFYNGIVAIGTACPTVTSTPGATPTASPTASADATPTPAGATVTATPTPTPAATGSPPSPTPTPSATPGGPTPTPTATPGGPAPTPTATIPPLTPGPGLVRGSADCNAVVDVVDALGVLRYVAALNVPPCISLADIDCDGDIDVVDALIILRFLAALPFLLPPGCPPIGVPVH